MITALFIIMRNRKSWIAVRKCPDVVRSWKDASAKGDSRRTDNECVDSKERLNNNMAFSC